MDPETRALVERSRKRRELLNQRFDNMPKASPRKRAVQDGGNSERVLAPQQSNEDGPDSCPYHDSPKRQCVRDMERQIKPDTPAIQGVQSRIKNMAAAQGMEDQENTVVPVPIPRRSISSPPLERKAKAPEMMDSTEPVKQIDEAMANTPLSTVGRKGRFAALAQSINSWEDDLTTHLPQKREEPKPTTTQSPVKHPSPIKKATSTLAVTKTNSPKKTPAPPTPRTPAVNTFSRSSPLRASKVELNRSPKPFTPASEPVTKPSVTKSVSDDTLTVDKGNKPDITPSKSCDTLISRSKPCDLNQTIDEPTNKPVSQRFASWEKRVQTPHGRPSDEPSKRPVSAKLAHFEREIVNSTPKTGLSSSAKVVRTQKQECTPVVSKASASVSSITRPKDFDPSELPISQRMSKMQEKLANSPIVRGGRKQDEPTAYPVGARMSAWETMTSASKVSDIKKVNPANVPTLSESQKKHQAPPPPPPPPASSVTKTDLKPQKSFKDSIQVKSREIGGTQKTVSSVKSPIKSVASPVKAVTDASTRSPSKVTHSPSKMSKGTKFVQERLIKKAHESDTTCSSLAAQSRAARMAELEAIQNRWKNGILKDEEKPDDKITSSDVKTATTGTPVSGRREEARNKARKEFANKLTEIGLEDENTTKSVEKETVSVEVQKSSAETNQAGNQTPSKTFSIYNLIKKRDEEKQDGADTQKSQKVKFHDSFFEDDDELMRKVPRSASLRAAQENPVEPETFKKPMTPPKVDPQPPQQLIPESDDASSNDITDTDSVTSSRTSLEIDDDDISLKGFVSEAVRRESILPQRPPPESSLDSYDEDDGPSDTNNGISGAKSGSNGYHPENESMDDDDDEDDDEDNNRGAVDDLLDEAMDDSSDAYDPDMDPRNVVLRRKPNREEEAHRRQPAEQEEYDPDMDINNVVLRRKPRPTNMDSPVAKKTRSHAMVMSTDDDDDDGNRPYSLSEYRKSVNVNQHHLEPVVRKSRHCTQQMEEEDIPMPSSRPVRRAQDDRRAVQERIQELQELVQQEQNVIMQTSNALNKCCMGNAYFAGSAEQVECNRLLLIACQKRQVYMKEIQRLKETAIVDPSVPGPRGSLTISDIRLPLKKDFVKKIGTSHDNTTHFFILLIRNGCQVICTQMLSTHDSMMRGSLDFPNLIKLNGISGDFKLALDIYGMSVCRETTLKDKKKKTPKKGRGGYATALESPGGPTAVRTTSFSHVDRIELNMRSLNKSSFHLDRLPHLSPLYGQIFMRFKCIMEAHVEEKGFLTMFDDVSGFGAWHRRWCVLSSNKLCVWKYPDDETRKDPMTMIDLKRCITEKVGLVPRDICARPNTFDLVTVRQPLKGEHDTLITKTHSTVTTVRHQMSADTKEERIMWCNKINKTLANLRTWNPDALRPTKPASSSSSSSSSSSYSYHH